MARDLSELLPELVAPAQGPGAGRGRRPPGLPPAVHAAARTAVARRGGVAAALDWASMCGWRVTKRICAADPPAPIRCCSPSCRSSCAIESSRISPAESPQTIISANVGCIHHLQSGTPIPVRHWVEVLDAALRPVRVLRTYGKLSDQCALCGRVKRTGTEPMPRVQPRASEGCRCRIHGSFGWGWPSPRPRWRTASSHGSPRSLAFARRPVNSRLCRRSRSSSRCAAPRRNLRMPALVLRPGLPGVRGDLRRGGLERSGGGDRRAVEAGISAAPAAARHRSPTAWQQPQSQQSGQHDALGAT